MTNMKGERSKEDGGEKGKQGKQGEKGEAER